MSKVIVEQALMGMRVVDNEDGNYDVTISVLGAQKLTFTVEGELNAKAMYTALEGTYLKALTQVQETVIDEHSKAVDAH